MSEPARVGKLLPAVLQEVIDRAGPGSDRWAELVAQAGYCHYPIRLAGRVEHADRQTGEVRTVSDSEREPDGVLLKACGTRRSPAALCGHLPGPTPTSSSPPASRAARASPTVAEHPRRFVTFTAPSFGRVHTPKAAWWGFGALTCWGLRWA
jgi:hypothetical protein